MVELFCVIKILDSKIKFEVRML